MTASEAERFSLLVHEVRSPVAALAAIDAVLVAGDVDDVARVELIGLALAACPGIARVVGDASVYSVELEDVEVGQLVRETAASARLLGGTVRADVELGLPTVTADPARLRQALDNLISNAVAHSPPGAEVVVSARRRGSEVVVSVADRGEGIAPEDQERVFEPGVRLAVDRPGLGLGLDVARAIALAHGGSLVVESTPGKGSTFTLSLPGR